MSVTTLDVPTLAGAVLTLLHDAETDRITGRLKMPASDARLQHDPSHWIAFIGNNGRWPRVDEPAYEGDFHGVWIGSAEVDVSEGVANTVRAWLDSRPRAAATPAADTLPSDIARPVAPGALA